jgi:cell wall-associated NlpC family hydrolase
MVNFNKTIFLKISLSAVLLLGFFGVIASRFPTKPYKGPVEISVATSESIKSDSVETDLPLRDSLEQFGKAFLGVPYVYGGTSGKGFDCSGFVYYVYDEFGIKVPRTSAQFADFGEEVPIEKVKKGDILIFLSPTRNVIGHIGIVTKANGMESEFIHASSSKEMKVMISSLKQPSYTRRLVKAVTVLKN